MKFIIHKLDGTLVEFRASWYHGRWDVCLGELDLPVTHRKVKRAIGWTMCTLTPATNGQVQSGASPLAQGDAACSASEPEGYNKRKGRVMSFGSALRMAGFKREERRALWQQYWGQSWVN